MWLKVFYWLRIFDKTAFFMNLLKRTLQDIPAFLIMLILAFTAFGNLFYIYNQWRTNRDFIGEGIFNEELKDQHFFNSLVYSYKLGLGDFDTENFTGENAAILWFIFLIATFFVQITFLNMLIAIMGDTFDKIMETRIESSLNEKIA